MKILHLSQKYIAQFSAATTTIITTTTTTTTTTTYNYYNYYYYYYYYYYSIKLKSCCFTVPFIYIYIGK